MSKTMPDLTMGTMQAGCIKTQGRTLGEVAHDLGVAFALLGIEPDEYGPTAGSGERDTAWPVSYRWIACYAVTGGSEGWYTHIDAIMPDRSVTNLLLCKCWSFQLALQVAHAAAWVLEGV